MKNNTTIPLLFGIGLAMVLLASCSGKTSPTSPTSPPPEAKNRPPGNFTASVDTTGPAAVLSWTAAADPDGDPVTYSVFLEGQQLHGGLSGTSAVLEGLEYETDFSGRLVASDGKGGTSETTYSFTSRSIHIQWETSLGGSGSDGAASIVPAPGGGGVRGGHLEFFRRGRFDQ